MSSARPTEADAEHHNQPPTQATAQQQSQPSTQATVQQHSQSDNRASAEADGQPSVEADPPHQNQPPIEVDDNLTENDSAYGDEVSTYTASLTSSITHYQYENGRRYHAFREGNYVFPNDETEADRLDIHNHMIKLRLGGRLHLAPVNENTQRILDLGTGTGIWAVTMGDEYPSAEIIGNDLSPIQPSMVPPNVRFLVDDVEDEWTYDTPFDYIHCRYLAGAIADWPKLIRKAYQHTKPGGWVEFQDWDIKPYSDDGSLSQDAAVAKWDDLIIEACAQNGRMVCPGRHLKEWITDAGFKNVHHEIFELPLGMWPKDKLLKDVGIWNILQIEQGMEGFTLAPLTRVLGWKPEEVKVLLAQVRKDMKNPNIHAYYNYHTVYAQKPKEKTKD